MEAEFRTHPIAERLGRASLLVFGPLQYTPIDYEIALSSVVSSDVFEVDRNPRVGNSSCSARLLFLR